MIEKLQSSPNIKIWNKSSVKRIYGERFVEGAEIEKEGEIYNIKAEGVFVEVGLIPNTEFADILSCNQEREIIVDCYNRTNIEGVFAAGDVTDVPQKQIIIACGEGAKATLSSFRYFSTRRF